VSIGTPGLVTDFRVVQIMNGTVSDVNEAVDSTSSDSSFRWDAAAEQWVFNIATGQLAPNSTYAFRISLNDGSWIDFRFGLR
jgi:hypothetical protein